MNTQVADTPNNWFQVYRDSGKWIGQAGKEVFDVDQKVDLTTGKILSATMDNPVVFESRECMDQQLTNCSKPSNHKLERKLTFTFEGRSIPWDSL